MKKIIFILCLVSVSCFSQTYDTLKSDLIIDSDTLGLHGVSYGTNLPLSHFEAYAGDGIYSSSFQINPYTTNYEISGNNVLYNINFSIGGIQLNAYNSVSTNKGVQLSLGSASVFNDMRTTKKGLQYFSNGYVTTSTSLTDKEYVDRNQLTSFTKTTLPSASPAGKMIFVSNATGGAVPAYSDGTNWRRVSDQTIIN